MDYREGFYDDKELAWPTTPPTTPNTRIHAQCTDCTHYKPLQWSVSVNGGDLVDKTMVPSAVESLFSTMTYPLPAIITISGSFGGPSTRYRKNW